MHFSDIATIPYATRWESNGWSNYEDIMLTGFAASDYKQCKALLRRSDKIAFEVCRAGPHQAMWLAAPPVKASIPLEGYSIRKQYQNKPEIRHSFMPRPDNGIHRAVIYDMRGAVISTDNAGKTPAHQPIIIDFSRSNKE